MITRYNLEIDARRHPVMVEEQTVPYETKMNSAELIVKMLNDCFRLKYQAEEKVYLIALDHRMRTLGVFEVAHGQASRCGITCREIYIRALAAGAESIVIAHNHTSGKIEPSEEDKLFCQQVNEAGQLLCIPLIDFLIVGDGYRSFKEEQLL